MQGRQASAAVIRLLGLFALWCCVLLPPTALAQDLSGTVWIFSVGNPPQPFPDNTWKIVSGAPGSPLSVEIQRGMEKSATLQGGFDGKNIEVQVYRQQSHGLYRGNLSGDGTTIEGTYSETRPDGQATQPFRLTRLDSLFSAEPIQLSWKQTNEDPQAVICKAFLPSDQRLKYSWSLDGQMQPAMTSEVRLTGVQPGAHRITAIGFDSQSKMLTAPQTLNFEILAPRSWDIPLVMVAMVLLVLAGLKWGRKNWIKAVEVDFGTPWKNKSRRPGQAAKGGQTVLELRGDGEDETLVQIRGGLAHDAQLLAPDPSPRLLLKKVEEGVMVRAVYLGARTARARLEVHCREQVIQVQVAVEPILLEIQAEFNKPGFATRRFTTAVGGLCGAVVGRIASAGQPVAFATCKASMRIDGGAWSEPVVGQSDAQGNFRFEMPSLMVRVLGMELSEFRLEKMDLPAKSSNRLEELCAAGPPGAAGTRVLSLPPEATEWLKSLGEWVSKVGPSH